MCCLPGELPWALPSAGPALDPPVGTVPGWPELQGWGWSLACWDPGPVGRACSRTRGLLGPTPTQVLQNGHVGSHGVEITDVAPCLVSWESRPDLMPVSASCLYRDPGLWERLHGDRFSLARRHHLLSSDLLDIIIVQSQ